MQLSELSQYFKVKNNFRAIYQRPGDRYKALDGIRAFSILTVVFFHTYFTLTHLMDEASIVAFNKTFPIALTWVTRGDYGVDLFFALSGFLIGSMLFREYKKTLTINLKLFYARRSLRLYPIFLVIIGMTAIGLLIAGSDDWKHLWANVLYVVNFIPYEDRQIRWSWSLAVEEQFYLVFPIIVLLGFKVFKSPLSWLSILFLASFAIRFTVLIQNSEIYQIDFQSLIFAKFESFTPVFFEQLYGNLHTRYGVLFTGGIAAYLHIYHQDKLKKNLEDNVIINNLLLTLSLITIATLYSLPVTNADINASISQELWLIYHTAHRNILGLSIATIILCVTYPSGLSRYLNRFLSLELFYPIAQLSYSMYLFHLPMAAAGMAIFFYSLGVENLSPIHIIPAGFIAVILTMLISTVLFVFVEKPFMDMRPKSIPTWPEFTARLKRQNT